MKNSAVSKKSPPEQPGNKNVLNLQQRDGVSQERAVTEAALSTITTSALNSANLAKLNIFANNAVSITDAVEVIEEKVRKIQAGNMAGVEAVLASQACTLDALFNNLTHRSILNMSGGHTDAAERYLRMALKAQSQCRTTLETLNEIKFPKAPTFIRQQNIAGQQQVNNGISASHEKDITPSNELLEGSVHGQRMDAGAARAAIANDPKMEALGVLNRPKVQRGEAAK